LHYYWNQWWNANRRTRMGSKTQHE
jgi:hypothetical protein